MLLYYSKDWISAENMFMWDTNIKSILFERKGFFGIFKNLLKTDNPVVLNDLIVVLYEFLFVDDTEFNVD
jgi:hypothetical protein